MNALLQKAILFFKSIVVNIKHGYSLIKVGESSAKKGLSRSDERIRKVILAGSSSIFYKVVTIATGLISIPLTVEYLGTERFSMWMICTSILSFMTFADLGLGNGLLNAISKLDGLNKRHEIKKYVSSVLFILIAISFIIGITLYFAYPYIEWYKLFNVTTDVAKAESGPVMIVIAVMFMINLPLGIIQKIHIGYQEAHINNLWLSLGSILGLLGVLVVIYFQMGLPWLIGAITGGPIFATFMNGIRLFFIERPYLRPNIKDFHFDIGRDMVKVGFIFFLLQIFSLVANVADNIIIAQVLGASYVATYAIAKKLFLLTQLGQYFIAPFWPAFNEAMARKEYKWAKEMFGKVLKVGVLTGILCALPILLFGDIIIEYWVNDSVVPSFSLLLGLFLWTFLVNYGGAMAVFLNNDTLVHTQLIMVGKASFSSLLFSIVLCYMYGIEGVIYGVLLGHALFFVLPAYRAVYDSLDNLINEAS